MQNSREESYCLFDRVYCTKNMILSIYMHRITSLRLLVPSRYQQSEDPLTHSSHFQIPLKRATCARLREYLFSRKSEFANEFARITFASLTALTKVKQKWNAEALAHRLHSSDIPHERVGYSGCSIERSEGRASQITPDAKICFSSCN